MSGPRTCSRKTTPSLGTGGSHGSRVFSPGPHEAQELGPATQHFFLPRCFQRPVPLNCSTVIYDAHDLLLLQAEDALHNQVTVGERGSGGSITNGNDYRVLQPARLMDPNGNRAAVAFDGLGLVVGTAAMGKTTETLGDSLGVHDGPHANPDKTPSSRIPKGQAAGMLGDATSRIVYDVTRYQRWQQAQASQPLSASAQRPPGFGATIIRETHFHAPGGASSKVQVSLSYSDGFGREIQRKIQAEPGPLIAGGPTVKSALGRQWLDDLQQQGQARPPVRALLRRHARLRVRRHGGGQPDPVLRPGRAGRRDAAPGPHLGEGRLRSVAPGELGRQRHGARSRTQRPRSTSARSSSVFPTRTTSPPGISGKSAAGLDRRRKMPRRSTPP